MTDPINITISTVLFFFSTLFFSELVYELKRLAKKVDEMQRKYYQVSDLIQEVKKLNEKLEDIEKKYYELDYKLRLIMQNTNTGDPREKEQK